jgi:hypothetical protein
MSLYNDDHVQDISIDAAALVVDIKTKDGSTQQIEAFSGPENKAILSSKSKEDYNRLFWKSFGAPELKVIDKSSKNAKRFLEFDKKGFLIKFELLTEEQKMELAKAAQFKYNIESIRTRQIYLLNVDSFKCTTTIMNPSSPHHNEVTFIGEALPGQSNMKTVRFKVPFSSNDRKILDKFVESDDHLEIHCQLIIHGKQFKTNSLTITTNQLKEIKLEEELFGHADSVYVTRNQMAKLTSNIKSIITSFENIEFDDKFDQTFTNDLLKNLTNNTTNVEEAVEINEALKCLSPYDYSNDITPDVINKDSKTIHKTEDHIKTTKDSSYKTKTGIKVNATGNNATLIEVSDNTTVDVNRENNKNENTSDDKLKKFVKDNNDTIEWEIEGESVIPKRIKVTRIMRSNLNKQFQFDNIKTRTFNEIINKKYSFSTKYIEEEKGNSFLIKI